MNFLPGRIISPDRVESGLGRLSVVIPQGLNVGEKVTLGIRPELIEIKKSARDLPGNGELVSGKTTMRSFLGNSVVYEVRVGETLLRVQTADDTFSPGEQVRLYCPADAWRLFLGS